MGTMPEPMFPGAQNKLVDLNLNAVALCNEGANSRAHIVLTKRKENPNMPKTFDEVIASLQTEDAGVITKHISDEDVAKTQTITGLQTTISNLQNTITTLQKNVPAPAPATAPTYEDIVKNADPQVAAVLKSLKDANDQLVKQAADNLAKSRFEAVKAIPADEATLKSILATASPAVYDLLVKAADAIEKGVLKDAKGTSTHNDDVASEEPYDKLDKAAKDIQKSKGNITFEQAFTQACNDNPAIYAEYVKGGK